MGVEELLRVAERAARAGGEVLRQKLGDTALEVRSKGDNDVVTSADHASEAAVLAVVRNAFPDHAVLAEEAGHSGALDGDLQWVIDPLDGTNNFLQGLPIFCVSVACCQGGKPVVGVVFDPVGDHIFAASRGGGAFWNSRPMQVSSHSHLEGSFLATGFPFRISAALDLYLAVFREVFPKVRGIRRCGSAALDLAYTAAGIYDGFFEFRLSPWDIAAGALLVEEAGGAVTDLDGGDRFFAGGNVLAGAPGVWRELQRAVARHADERALELCDLVTREVVD